MRLQGKTALITGGSTGIGQAIAETFAREGAQVIFTGRNTARGNAVAEAINKAGGKATFIEADLDSTQAVNKLVLLTYAATDRIDILVNNAGIYSFGPTNQTLEADFDNMFNLNVKMPYFLTAALAPRMVEQGSGKVINITTAFAHVGEVGIGAYGATKAALTLLTKSWAAEYGPSGVNVNAIAPGLTITPTLLGIFGEGVNQLTGNLPARRTAITNEMADAALYLASDESNYVHGATLPVDGGRIAI